MNVFQMVCGGLCDVMKYDDVVRRLTTLAPHYVHVFDAWIRTASAGDAVYFDDQRDESDLGLSDRHPRVWVIRLGRAS